MTKNPCNSATTWVSGGGSTQVYCTVKQTVRVDSHDGRPIDYVRALDWPLVVVIGVIALAIAVFHVPEGKP